MKKWSILACLLAFIVLLAACRGTNGNETTGSDAPAGDALESAATLSDTASSEAESSSEDGEPSVAGLYVNEAPVDESTLTDVLILQEDGTFTREVVAESIFDGVDVKITTTGTYRMDGEHCWTKVTGTEIAYLGLDEADGDELQAYLDSLQEEGDDEAFDLNCRLFAGEVLDGTDVYGEEYMALLLMIENDNILNTEAKTFRTKSSF